MRFILIAAGVMLLLFIGALALLNDRELSPDELVRRCDENYPAWNGYQEDIKEIGARPVAQWRGEPSSLTLSEGTARLIFLLEAPWNRWDAALPVLLKTPEGHVFRNADYGRNGSRGIYVFILSSDPKAPIPPWLEVQYPHTKQRLHLDAQGNWNAGAPG